jgi:hypothetical protein
MIYIVILNGKIVDEFNILDTNYISTPYVSATQQLHTIIMEQKNEINNLTTRLARNDTNKIRKEILKYLRERYSTIHQKDSNVEVSAGTFTSYFD